MLKHVRRDIVWALLVSLVALLPRLFQLDVFLTADEPKSWFGRSIQFLDALAQGDFIATFDSPAPGVTTMWAGSIGLLLDYARQGFPGSLVDYLAAVPFDPLDPAILPLIRLPIVLLAVLTAVLTYWWGRVVFGQTAAILAALFIALDPFLLALTRILGHDGPVTLFMWLSLLAFLRGSRGRESVNTGQLTVVSDQSPVGSRQLSDSSNQPSSSTPAPPISSSPHLPIPPSPSPPISQSPHSPFFILLSGAFGGLAFLSKYPSLFLGAFLAVTMLILHLQARQSWSQLLRRWLIDVAIWSAAAGAVFILLWPAMWIDPVGRPLAILNDALRASGSPHQKGSFFFGQPVPDPGLSYYLIVTLFKTTPVLWLGWLLLLVSSVVAFFKGRQGTEVRDRGSGIGSQSSVTGEQSGISQSTSQPISNLPISQFSILHSPFSILLAFALAFTLLVTIGGKKQDRYILPVFPALATLAAIGYAQGLQLIEASWRQREDERRKTKDKISASVRRPSSVVRPITNYYLPFTLVALQATFTLPYFPYFFSYYNPLLGGGQAAAKTIIVGWGEGLDEAARWLNSRPNAETLDAVAWYSTTFEPYFTGHSIYKIEEEKISRTPKPGLAADYVIFYVNQIQRQLPTEGALQFYQTMDPAHTVRLNGLDYAWIYPSPKLQRIIVGESRLVGQAELLGFNLLDVNGNRLEATPADRPATLELYWEWQGKASDEPLGLNLIDQNGNIWGRGKSHGTQARLPVEQWQDGMVAHDTFTLEIYPGTPSGDYYLNVRIDRPATGEQVGIFLLDWVDAQLTVGPPLTPPTLQSLPLETVLDAPLLAERVTLRGLTDSQGFSDPWSPGETRELALYWQVNRTINETLPLRLALIDSTGQLRAEWPGLPAAGLYPTDRWQRGDVIRDPWRIALPPHVPPGDYTLTTQLGDSPPVDLLPVAVEGRPRRFEPPPLALSLDTQFGPGIDLLGLGAAPMSGSNLVIQPGQPLELDLVWQAVGLIEADYTLTAQLLDAEQQVRAQRDQMPLDGTAPTGTWTPGEILIDPIRLDLPTDLGPGPHRLLLALYQVETGQRLPLPNGADHLTLPVVNTIDAEQ